MTSKPKIFIDTQNAGSGNPVGREWPPQAKPLRFNGKVFSWKTKGKQDPPIYTDSPIQYGSPISYGSYRDVTGSQSTLWTARTFTFDSPTVKTKLRKRTTNRVVEKPPPTIWKDQWMWEGLSLLLSVGCLIAMGAILGWLDNKQLADWTFPIQPNAMISVFSVVLKAALILPVAESIGQLKWLYFIERNRSLMDLQHFDDASRGPLGSIYFLFRFTPKGKYLASSLGAFITIIALAIDPFAQQIIEFNSRSVPTIGDATAVFNVAHTYEQHYALGNTIGLVNPDSPAILLVYLLTHALVFRQRNST
jgi:hypothetical protein